MQTTLQTGQVIETTTPDEMRTLLREIAEYQYSMQGPANVFDIEVALVATAAGLVAEVDVFEVPMGYTMSINRIHINAAGVTPLAPLAAGYLQFFTGDSGVPSNMWMFVPASGTQVAPVVITESETSGRQLRGGQRILIAGASFAANQRLYVTMQCKLQPWDFSKTTFSQTDH